MDVEGLELENLNPIGNDKRKKILVAIFSIIALVVIAVIVVSAVRPQALDAYFTDNRIRPNTETTLVIAFHNLGDKDLHNVLFKVTSENPNIIINSTSHTEPVIGAGAYRKLEIPVSVGGNLTQGSYRFGILVDTGEKKYTQNIYLEVTK